jgi:hypothetical protein
LSATEGYIAELFRSFIKLAAVVPATAAAFPGFLVKQRLGLFDSGHRQVMRLDSVAVILYHEQIHPGRVQHADHHDGQQRQTPEQADED